MHKSAALPGRPPVRGVANKEFDLLRQPSQRAILACLTVGLPTPRIKRLPGAAGSTQFFCLDFARHLQPTKSLAEVDKKLLRCTIIRECSRRRWWTANSRVPGVPGESRPHHAVAHILRIGICHPCRLSSRHGELRFNRFGNPPSDSVFSEPALRVLYRQIEVGLKPASRHIRSSALEKSDIFRVT